MNARIALVLALLLMPTAAPAWRPPRSRRTTTERTRVRLGRNATTRAPDGGSVIKTYAWFGRAGALLVFGIAALEVVIMISPFAGFFYASLRFEPVLALPCTAGGGQAPPRARRYSAQILQALRQRGYRGGYDTSRGG